MRRRAFVTGLGAVLATPLAAEAQQMHRIGFVSTTSPVPEPIPLRAFRQGLRELGYVDGQNVIIDARFAEGRSERFPELIAELTELKVDVLVIGSIVGALAAKKATKTVPVVFAGGIDPVGQGIVASWRAQEATSPALPSESAAQASLESGSSCSDKLSLT